MRLILIIGGTCFIVLPTIISIIFIIISLIKEIKFELNHHHDQEIDGEIEVIDSFLTESEKKDVLDRLNNRKGEL